MLDGVMAVKYGTLLGEQKLQSLRNMELIEGGPLEHDRYELIQFHSHWGRQDDKGSEHTVNGHHYASEIHFVHWNKDKCISPQQAASQYGGLAVIGVLLELGSENKELNKICSALNKVALKGQELELDDPIDSERIFPKKDRTYWTYDGSLTTPPCHESVKWIIFKSPVEVSWEQPFVIVQDYFTLNRLPIKNISHR
ncbi:Carbonic anhydrase 1 [Nymphon striatum]|nr:Carbonic anhydrase 1 [Nymphon striatum]